MSAATGTMVPEDLRHVEQPVAGTPPDLGAARLAAGNLEMAAPGCLRGRAAAGLPADRHGAGPPRVMRAALQREGQPVRLFVLLHGGIQTRNRLRRKALRRGGQDPDRALSSAGIFWTTDQILAVRPLVGPQEAALWITGLRSMITEDLPGPWSRRIFRDHGGGPKWLSPESQEPQRTQSWVALGRGNCPARRYPRLRRVPVHGRAGVPTRCGDRGLRTGNVTLTLGL
jgi:hypothetical protein